MRLIRLMSRIGIAATPDTAALPALLAATGPQSRGDQLFGPKRLIGGPRVEVKMWSPLDNTDDASRLWDVSQQLVGARFVA